MKYIYKITNTANGKIYIGKTETSIQKRFKEHILEANRFSQCVESGKDFGYESRLYAAMHKYGSENFQIEVLAEFCDDIDINQKEKEFIYNYGTTDANIGYNISSGGLGGPLFKGHRHSQETKALISKRSKGRKQTAEFIAKRMQKKQYVYQNLTTKESFIGIAAAQTAYPNANIHYAVKYTGKTCNNYWIKLPVNSNPLSDVECDELVAQYEFLAHKGHSERSKKIWEMRDEESRNLAIQKFKTVTAAARANRTEEQRVLISKHLSEARKGKKHSPETIEKLKNYYKTASAEALALRNAHNSAGQKGKKRYENLATGKHKMFTPGTAPDGWIEIAPKKGIGLGRRKYRNILTGECKMFYPESVDETIWKKVVNNEKG